MNCLCKNCCKDCIKINTASKILKIVAEPNRLKVLCFLLEGSKCAGEIAKSLNLEHNLVSFHLRMLMENNFLQRRKEGNRVYYSVNEEQRENIEGLLDLSK